MNSESPMKRLGLIGYPLTHSFSRSYFGNKFKEENLSGYCYDNFEIQRIEEFPVLISRFPDLIGLNVTIPYKKSVVNYLDRLDPTAAAIGAVNTIRIENIRDRKLLTGYNTDVQGFLKSLEGLIGSDRPAALIFGSGGASLAVRFVLEQLGIEHKIVSRKKILGQLTYAGLDTKVIIGHRLLINCTPLGTYPEVDRCIPIPFDGISSGHYLYDLVYNPPETVFLKTGLERGAKIKNGYEMLTGQAEESWKIWTRDS